MSTGFEDLAKEVQGSNAVLLQEVRKLLASQDALADTSHLHLRAGQRDLVNSLNGIERLILCSNDRLASQMKVQFVEQRQALESMLQTGIQDNGDAMAIQMRALVSHIAMVLS
jgi:calcineurin-like phosphoesterase family protein